MDGTDGNQVRFAAEDINVMIKGVIESILTGQEYVPAQVDDWTARIGGKIIENLQSQEKPFKYIANVAILQKAGAGLHQASSCYWDAATDGSSIVRWENKGMHCIVCVYGISL